MSNYRDLLDNIEMDLDADKLYYEQAAMVKEEYNEFESHQGWYDTRMKQLEKEQQIGTKIMIGFFISLFVFIISMMIAGDRA